MDFMRIQQIIYAKDAQFAKLVKQAHLIVQVVNQVTF